MSECSQNSLSDMYDNLKEEADNINQRIQENLTKIAEIDTYIKNVHSTEDADFKFFSPRNVDSLFKDNLDDNKAIKYKLESDNRILYSKLNKINSNLECIGNAINKSNLNKNLKVLDMQELERQRIARDLHDTSLQNLAHLVHKLELASLYIDKDPIQAKLEIETTSKSLKSTIEEIRNTVFDLRPMHFDDLGLKETLESMFKKLKDSNPSFDFEYEISDIVCTNDIILLAIYRVIQEACNNAVKHSDGNKVYVSVAQCDDICHIIVRDNGIGFNPEETESVSDKHYGMEIMRERIELAGGTIQYNTQEKNGTEISIDIPLD